MAAMTRSQFVALCHDVFRSAVQNLRRDGAVSTVLLALNARGHQVVRVLVVQGTEEERQGESAEFAAARAEAAQAGATVIVGTPESNAEELRQLCREHRAVAGIFITEAWRVSGDASHEVLTTGMAAADHPDREDVLLVTGAWPREFVDITIVAALTAGPGGVRRAGEAAARPGPCFPWLSAVLPGGDPAALA